MKTEDLLKEVEEKGIITERQMMLLKRRLNDGKDVDLQSIWDNTPELEKEHNQKGYDFLMDKWKTPSGRERKNNPFGYREEEILNSFTHFELAGFHDASRYGGMPFFLPLYNCCGKEGCFQYYYDFEGVHIIG